MHTKAHFRDHHFGIQWSPAKVSVTILLTLLFLVLLFLFMTITATSADGQNPVPPTARQAASIPQYAAKLAHGVRPASPYNASRVARPTDPQASWKNPADPRLRNRRGGPLDDTVLYENGPINGTTDAWTINEGFVVSNTFTVPSGGSPVIGMSFGAWVFPGRCSANGRDIHQFPGAEWGHDLQRPGRQLHPERLQREPVRLQCLHRNQRQLQWPKSRRRNLLGEPAKRRG